jgi:hypothetical protein
VAASTSNSKPWPVRANRWFVSRQVFLLSWRFKTYIQTLPGIVVIEFSQDERSPGLGLNIIKLHNADERVHYIDNNYYNKGKNE